MSNRDFSKQSCEILALYLGKMTGSLAFGEAIEDLSKDNLPFIERKGNDNKCLPYFPSLSKINQR